MRRALAFAVVVLAGLAAGALILHPWQRYGVDRVRHLVRWPGDCADVKTEHFSRDDVHHWWPHAVERGEVECEMLGPWIRYARFDTRAALRTDLLHDSQGIPACIARRQVVLNGLFHRGQFVALCRQLHGDVVDGVSSAPDPPPGAASPKIDRFVHDEAAQHRALERYFAR